MFSDMLVGAAVLFAATNVLVGGVIAWGVSGGDGPSSPARGLLGLGVLGAFLASLVGTAWLLQPVFRATMAVAVVALIAGSSYALAAAQDARRRWWVAAAIAAAGALVSMVVGIAGAATQVSGRAVVLAGLGPAGGTIAIAALAVTGAEDLAGERTGVTVALVVLCIPSALLALAWSAG